MKSGNYSSSTDALRPGSKIKIRIKTRPRIIREEVDQMEGWEKDEQDLVTKRTPVGQPDEGLFEWLKAKGIDETEEGRMLARGEKRGLKKRVGEILDEEEMDKKKKKMKHPWDEDRE
jgi:hypothetical protein